MMWILVSGFLALCDCEILWGLVRNQKEVVLSQVWQGLWGVKSAGSRSWWWQNLGTSEGHSLQLVEFELFRDTFIIHKFSCRSKAGWPGWRRRCREDLPRWLWSAGPLAMRKNWNCNAWNETLKSSEVILQGTLGRVERLRRLRSLRLSDFPLFYRVNSVSLAKRPKAFNFPMLRLE